MKEIVKQSCEIAYLVSGFVELFDALDQVREDLDEFSWMVAHQTGRRTSALEWHG